MHQDEEKAMELWTEAAKVGSIQARHNFGFGIFSVKGGDLKKSKFTKWQDSALKTWRYSTETLDELSSI